jgi:hypothetical protein
MRTFAAMTGVCALALAGLVAASAPDAAAVSAEVRELGPDARNGASASITLRWNAELLARFGIAIDGLDRGDSSQRAYRLAPLDAAVSAPVTGLGLAAPATGSVQFVDGPRLLVRGQVIDLRHARLVIAGERWRIVDADGIAWFTLSHVMPVPDVLAHSLQLRTADLRIATALARAARYDDATDIAVAEAQGILPFTPQPAGKDTRACGAPNWHGNAVPGGGTFATDVFLTTLAAQFMRCQGCDGGGGSDGLMVVAPSTTLTNNRNLGTFEATVPGDPLGTSAVRWTADVPWYTKFMGIFAPYANDQHPYLIWNLYRIDSEGAIAQIGRSGTKHAIATANAGTDCESCNGGHVLGRACFDPYGLGSNDSPSELGPRSEVIPATGQWGRCGSVFDVDCDGVNAHPPTGPYELRLRLLESQIDPAVNAGARYFIEGWYVVRDDVAIFNTMGTRPLTFAWNPSSQLWNIGNQPSFRLGSVLDRWLETTAPAAISRDALLTTPEGDVRVTVRVRALGNGRWRYDYAVMNFDFSRAITSGSEPNLRVLRNHGFDRFTVPVRNGAAVEQTTFDDGDTQPGNDWAAQITADEIVWQAPDASGSLDWGSLYRFSVIADRAPETGDIALHVTEPGSPAQFTVSSFAVGSSALFADGFE